MRAELVFLGRRVSMASRRRRRTIVVSMYALLVALLTAGWLMDRWRMTGVYFLIYGALFANYFFLGGNAPHGLVKPFNGKAPKPQAIPSSVLELKLRSYAAMPDEDEKNYSNDERELEQRDRAHYRAYHLLATCIVLLWAVQHFYLYVPNALRVLPVSVELLVNGGLLICMVLSLTLPQSILLWSEPDMQEEQGDARAAKGK